MGTYLLRISSISIGRGVVGNQTLTYETYEWTGIKYAKWEDTSPWEHIEIPRGAMIHQHLHSVHFDGEIACLDLASLTEALWATEIDSSSHKAISAVNFKYPVDYLVIHAVDNAGNIQNFTCTDFRVNTVSVQDIELGKETVFVVKFSADLVALTI